MRNIPVVIGIAAMAAMAVEAPICEEFAGESGISCTSTGNTAVITSYGTEVKTVEFYANGKKAYLEIGVDGHVMASSGRRTLEVDVIPASGDAEYLEELLDGLLEDIAWDGGH